jgi:hypothetical protein
MGCARSAAAASREGSPAKQLGRAARSAARLHTVAESRETFSETALGSCRVQLDRGHVAPEILEPVVRPRLRREDVQDDIEVVDEDPVALRLALHRARRQPVFGLQAFADLVVDRLRLPRVAPRAEDEEVGVDADGPQIEDDDVVRQLLLSEAGDAAGLFERVQGWRRSFRVPRSV